MKLSFLTFDRGHKRIADAEALADFVVRESSLIAQKTIVDYCHMKTRLALTELTKEKPFSEAFDAARSAGFAAVVADLVAAVEAHLRQPAGARAGELPRLLARLYADCLGRFQPAVAAAEQARLTEELEHRLARLQLAPPKSSAELGLRSGNAVFDALPIHPRLRKYDREPVVDGLRFLLMSRCQRLGERLDAAALLPALAARYAAAAPRADA